MVLSYCYLESSKSHMYKVNFKSLFTVDIKFSTTFCIIGIGEKLHVIWSKLWGKWGTERLIYVKLLATLGVVDI